jgi:hypothetical protein
VSKTARRRIRTFSVWIWVWGALVLFVGAQYLALPEAQRGRPDNIRIPLEEHDQAPYQAILTFDNDVDLFVTSPEDLALPEAQRGRPDNIAYLHRQGDTILVVPGDSDLELWVRGNGSWEITLQKAALREMMDGYASDTSNVFLVYRGDAVSARFIHKGAGTSSSPSKPWGVSPTIGSPAPAALSRTS